MGRAVERGVGAARAIGTTWARVRAWRCIAVSHDSRRARCAQVLLALSLALLPIGTASAKQCPPCGPLYCIDAPAAASLKAAKKAEMARRGIPPRLTALVDRLPDCPGCVMLAPDGFGIMLEYDQDGYEAATGFPAPVYRIMQWTRDLEQMARRDVRDGRLSAYRIIYATKACHCCGEATYAARSDWDARLGINTDLALNHVGPAGLGDDPPDLTEIDERFRPGGELVLPELELPPPVRLVQTLCDACKPIEEERNGYARLINDLNRRIAQTIRSLRLLDQRLVQLTTEARALMQLASTPQTEARREENAALYSAYAQDHIRLLRTLSDQYDARGVLEASMADAMARLGECEASHCPPGQPPRSAVTTPAPEPGAPRGGAPPSSLAELAALGEPPGGVDAAARGSASPESPGGSVVGPLREVARLTPEQQLEQYLQTMEKVAAAYREKIADGEAHLQPLIVAVQQAEAAVEAAQRLPWFDPQRRQAEHRLYMAKIPRDLAQRNVDALTDALAKTEARIRTTTEAGAAPAGVGGLGSEFVGLFSEFGSEEARGWTYRAYKRGGTPLIFTTWRHAHRLVDLFLEDGGAQGSQFLHSAPGHAQGPDVTGGPGAGLMTYESVEGHRLRLMRDGVLRNLRNAVEQGDVAGTVETDFETRFDKVTIFPEGLDAARPYLDVLDALVADEARAREIAAAIQEAEDEAWELEEIKAELDRLEGAARWPGDPCGRIHRGAIKLRDRLVDDRIFPSEMDRAFPSETFEALRARVDRLLEICPNETGLIGNPYLFEPAKPGGTVDVPPATPGAGQVSHPAAAAERYTSPLAPGTGEAPPPPLDDHDLVAIYSLGIEQGLINLEAIRQQGDCQAYNFEIASLRRRVDPPDDPLAWLDPWSGQAKEVSPATKTFWREKLAEAEARPCPPYSPGLLRSYTAAADRETIGVEVEQVFPITGNNPFSIAPLGGDDRVRTVTPDGSLVVVVPDVGVPDVGVPDAGVPDAGVPDAGVPGINNIFNPLKSPPPYVGNNGCGLGGPIHLIIVDDSVVALDPLGVNGRQDFITNATFNNANSINENLIVFGNPGHRCQIIGVNFTTRTFTLFCTVVGGGGSCFEAFGP